MPVQKRATNPSQSQLAGLPDLPSPQSAPASSPGADTGDYAACLSSLSRVLRRWRAGHKRKIADAAGYLGVATATWGHWETGKRAPALETLHLLARLVGIPARCLICPQVERCHFSSATPFCPQPGQEVK